MPWAETCHDKDDLLLRLDLFKEVCLENNCFGAARKFKTGHARFHYFATESADPKYVPYQSGKPKYEAIVLSALPGTGKDTWVRNNLPKDYPAISTDQIRREMKIKPGDKSGTGKVFQQCYAQAKEYMRKGQSFVWNSTNYNRNIREKLIAELAAYGGKVRIVYLEVPYKRLVRQNKNREWPVNEKVFNKFLSGLQVPQLWEAHQVDYIVEDQE